MFNAMTTAYLFLGGTGGGMCAVLSLLGFAQSRNLRKRGFTISWAANRISSRFELPSDFFPRAWPCCLAILAFAALCLIFDVGRPDRVAELFFEPTFSAMSVGSFALLAAISASMVFSVSELSDTWHLDGVAAAIARTIGLASGVAVAVYTGVLLSSLASVMAYWTALLPILLTLSSLSCGSGCALAVLALSNPRWPHGCAMLSLARADSVLILLEAASLVAYVAWLGADGGTSLGAQALLSGNLRQAFWVGLVACGLALSFTLEQLAAFGGSRPLLIAAVICLLAGGVSLRVCVTGVAAYDVTQMAGASMSMLL